MRQTLIGWLNKNIDGGDVLVYSMIAFVAWFIFWKLLLGRVLEKCYCNSFWYALYELGAAGTFLLIFFLLFITVLFITSFQALSAYGLRMIFVLSLFWGGVITLFVFLIKHIKK